MSVDSLVFDGMVRVKNELALKTKIIEKLGPFGIPPWVVHPGLKTEMKEKLKTIFLAMHKDEAGKVLLRKIAVEKFVLVNDEIYDSVTDMYKWVQEFENKGKSR